MLCFEWIKIIIIYYIGIYIFITCRFPQLDIGKQSIHFILICHMTLFSSKIQFPTELIIKTHHLNFAEIQSILMSSNRVAHQRAIHHSRVCILSFEMRYDRLASVIVFDEQCSKYENHSIYKSQIFNKKICEYESEWGTGRTSIFWALFW